MAVPVKVGSEFVVNTQTAGDQINQSITALSDGGFVVTWQDRSGTPGGDSSYGSYSVKAQIYAADGSKSGSEFVITPHTDGADGSFTSLSDITSLSNGGFVVSWCDNNGKVFDENSNGLIVAQIYAADGSKVGSEFLVNTNTDGLQLGPAITGLSNGGFVITWVDKANFFVGYGSADVRAQVYDASGNKIGAEVLLNAPATINRSDLTVVSLNDGGFVVAWEELALSANHKVVAQVFAADGSRVGSELLIGRPSGLIRPSSSIASLSDGGFVATWSGNYGDVDGTRRQFIYGQLYDATGGEVGAEFVVALLDDDSSSLGGGFDHKIASMSDGGFVVTWLGYSGITGQHFAADGSQVGSPFPIKTLPFSNGAAGAHILAVTSLGDDRFIVTWESDGAGGDGNGVGIKAQIFTFAPPPTPSIVSVSDDVGPQTGALAHGGTSDDGNLTVRISTGSNFIGDTIQLLDGATALGDPIVLTAADIARGYVDFQTGALSDGTHAISARVTDISGETGSSAAPFSVTVDSSPVTVDNSTVAITGIVPDSSNLPGVTVNGIIGPAAAGLTVSVYHGARLVGTTTADGDGHWTLAGVTLAGGANNLTATVPGSTGTISSAVFAGPTVLTTARTVSSASDADFIVLGGGKLEIGFGISMTGSVVIGNGGVETDYGNTTETVVASGGVQNVYYGGISNNTVVEAGGYQGVYYGTANGTQLSGSQQVLQAIANDTAVLNGGTQFVRAGSEAVRSVVHQGGYQHIDVNATATDTIVDGGSQVVRGSANATIVSGGNQVVYGAADHTTIGDGSTQLVFGSVTDTTIAGGSAQTIYGGGTATGTTVNTDGTQFVWGTAIDTTINGGAQTLLGTATDTTIILGIQHVQAGGEAVRSVVHQAGSQYIDLNATATDTIVDGGSQFVSGSANGTIVSGGGNQYVYTAADRTTIGDGGAQLVFGSVTDTTIGSGGEQKIYSDGTATGTIVNTDGTQIVWGTAISTTIDGGAQFLLGTATDTTIILGTQYVQAGGHAIDTTIGSGTVEYVYAGGTANGVTFAGPYAYLALEQSSAFTGTISGWQDNDYIGLGDILFSESGTTLAYSENADQTGGVLTVSDGTHLATLTLLGQYSAADFALSSDGQGGALISNPVAVEQNLLAPALAA